MYIVFCVVVKVKRQSTTKVDYNGPRSHMSAYIQTKYNEMNGQFVYLC